MEQFEKVEKGLETHLKPNSRCAGCPYPNNGLCGDQLYRDVLSLIRAQQERIREMEAGQEPRVMTLEEVRAIGEAEIDNLDRSKTVVVWVQINARNPFNGNLYPSRIEYSYHPEWGDTEYMDSIKSAVFGSDITSRLPCCDYNKTWCCWTSRPTDEQREAETW